MFCPKVTFEAIKFYDPPKIEKLMRRSSSRQPITISVNPFSFSSEFATSVKDYHTDATSITNFIAACPSLALHVSPLRTIPSQIIRKEDFVVGLVVIKTTLTDSVQTRSQS